MLKQMVVDRVGIHAPDLQALSEVRFQIRLRVDREVLYLSAPVVAQGDTADAYISPVGFVVTRAVLVTVRFADSDCV